jgi:hypothetical protein
MLEQQASQQQQTQGPNRRLLSFICCLYLQRNNEKEYDRKEKTKRLCVLRYET